MARPTSSPTAEPLTTMRSSPSTRPWSGCWPRSRVCASWTRGWSSVRSRRWLQPLASSRSARTSTTSGSGLILVAIWSALPISIVQSMAYSESLFTALVSWCLLATVRHRYVVAGVLASLAGLTRPSGGAVAIAVIVSAALHIRAVGLPRSPPTSRSREAARARLGALLAASGTLGFLGYVAVQTQDALGYFKVADRWGNNVDGGAAFLGWIVQTVASERVVSGLLLVCSLATAVGSPRLDHGDTRSRSWCSRSCRWR